MKIQIDKNIHAEMNGDVLTIKHSSDTLGIVHSEISLQAKTFERLIEFYMAYRMRQRMMKKENI